MHWTKEWLYCHSSTELCDKQGCIYWVEVYLSWARCDRHNLLQPLNDLQRHKFEWVCFARTQVKERFLKFTLQEHSYHQTLCSTFQAKSVKTKDYNSPISHMFDTSCLCQKKTNKQAPTSSCRWVAFRVQGLTIKKLWNFGAQSRKWFSLFKC